MLEPALGIHGRGVAAVLDSPIGSRPLPRFITVDHGTAFIPPATRGLGLSSAGFAAQRCPAGQSVETKHIELFCGRFRVLERRSIRLTGGCPEKV